MTVLGKPVAERIPAVDPIWTAVRDEAMAAGEREPVMAGFLYAAVLNHDTLEAALAHRIGQRLDHADLPACHIERAFEEMAASRADWGGVLRIDLQAVFDRDPACERYIEPLLYFKGFHAIQTHRLAHWLWHGGRKDFALYLQSRSSSVFQTDIHPAARMGRGIFLDHATGLVVGFTAAIGDNVSILQDVTLGGTGKEFGDRHPKIGNGVLIGAGAKILGNIKVGDCSKIASGSVVLAEVPPHSTVAGVPARIVGGSGCAEPARSMDQKFTRAE
ncbi:serine O-acetyltransferase [Aureimonas sp. ME7]|uniref:serine O-acetyltransferase n=1 Tax=Aureimonas sp. ME7 TaxID=2744252 RepID=UPI0015F6A6A9|nr:serine O-acetyltransferase [Aureimonas sp. ME7]